ncbi:Panacea domain-containing protein [Caulobacter sp. LjRoot300]|uniref:Panacea domain-containing protein n=1 Tax=Caulobacter sp. LjRoot300 TaxID=3342321 RepID=UPI003ED08BC8
MPYKAVEIANEFLRLPGAAERLTQMQLQKLTYIAHGWNWAINDAPLIIDDIEAWSFGPVVRDLYEHTKFFGSEPIGRLISPDDSKISSFFGKTGEAAPYRADLTPREREVIAQVWSRYGDLSAARLSALTHQPDTPWFKAFQRGRNTRIEDEVIRTYYDALAQRAA